MFHFDSNKKKLQYINQKLKQKSMQRMIIIKSTLAYLQLLMAFIHTHTQISNSHIHKHVSRMQLQHVTSLLRLYSKEDALNMFTNINAAGNKK